MRTVLIILSTILVLCSPVVYIHSILYGKTRPHRTTRFVLMVITLLSAAALFSNYKSAAFWLAGASAVQGSLVFLLSIKRGVGGWAKLDLYCLIIAGLGIVLWQTTGRPIVGLYASIVADLIGCVPALVKTYKYPDTENWQFFAMDTVAAILSFAALGSLTVFSISYPIYIFLFNFVMVLLILYRRRVLSFNK